MKIRIHSSTGSFLKILNYILIHSIPYRTKIRQIKLSKFRLGVENFVCKILSDKVYRNETSNLCQRKDTNFTKQFLFNFKLLFTNLKIV